MTCEQVEDFLELLLAPHYYLTRLVVTYVYLCTGLRTLKLSLHCGQVLQVTVSCQWFKLSGVAFAGYHLKWHFSLNRLTFTVVRWGSCPIWDALAVGLTASGGFTSVTLTGGLPIMMRVC